MEILLMPAHKYTENAITIQVYIGLHVIGDPLRWNGLNFTTFYIHMILYNDSGFEKLPAN